MKNKISLLSKIYNIAIIVTSIIVGLIFIVFAYTIYGLGLEQIKIDPTYQIYTPELITSFSWLLLTPLILWILLIIFGVVLNNFTPKKEKNNSIDAISKYKILKNRTLVDEGQCVDELKEINKQRTFRTVAFIVFSIVALCCLIYPAQYLFTASNFSTNHFDEFTNMAIHVLPFIVVIFALFSVYAYLYYRSITKEIAILLSIAKVAKMQPKKTIENKKKYIIIWVVRGIILAVAISFIIVGICNGDFKIVLDKAINICAECIGLA